MPDLTLYAEDQWFSPWVFHAMVALDEKGLDYQLDVLALPLAGERRAAALQHALLAKVPLLRHGETWFTESLAISEYLAETFPWPDHPRLFPADLRQRARARQVMNWLRTSLFALREARPTASFLGAGATPVTTPLDARARADADQLIRIASALIGPGRGSLADAWCIADADLALALQRLIANRDPVPDHLVAYVDQTWQRPSLRRFLSRDGAAA